MNFDSQNVSGKRTVKNQLFQTPGFSHDEAESCVTELLAAPGSEEQPAASMKTSEGWLMLSCGK